MEATPSTQSTPSITAAVAAIEKYFLLTDNPQAVHATMRRVFFEFLRTRPTLSQVEVDNLWVVADLIAELEAARPA